jgi:hypothetical protein
MKAVDALMFLKKLEPMVPAFVFVAKFRHLVTKKSPL